MGLKPRQSDLHKTLQSPLGLIPDYGEMDRSWAETAGDFRPTLPRAATWNRMASQFRDVLGFTGSTPVTMTIDGKFRLYLTTHTTVTPNMPKKAMEAAVEAAFKSSRWNGQRWVELEGTTSVTLKPKKIGSQFTRLDKVTTRFKVDVNSIKEEVFRLLRMAVADGVREVFDNPVGKSDGPIGTTVGLDIPFIFRMVDEITTEKQLDALELQGIDPGTAEYKVIVRSGRPIARSVMISKTPTCIARIEDTRVRDYLVNSQT